MSDVETAAMVRRGQRLIRMVGELHRLGYQRLRIMPYEHPLAWRLMIGPVDGFSSMNGAYWPGSIEPCPTYTSASETAYFDWTDARRDNARQLAAKFIARFPDHCEAGRGRDWPYAGWLSELLGVLEADAALPVVMAEFMTPPPEEMRSITLRRYGVNAGDRQFSLPPPGRLAPRTIADLTTGPASLLIAACGAKGGKDLRTLAAVSTLVGVAMGVGAQMFMQRDDDACHELLSPVADALAGIDPDYVVDRRWCCLDRLGASATRGFALPAGIAEPGLQPTLLFGLEHISLAVREVLSETEGQADWEGVTWPLLVELQSFAASVLLGTASALYRDQTLWDFVARRRRT